MNTKAILTTLAAAATLGAAGFAVAQADPPSSTAGNNCTATGNAMRGGNMSAHPSGTACTPSGTANTAAATAAPATSATAAAPAADSTAMGNSGATASSGPARVAKADRN